ncbi:wax ester/triacylglycerol synthase family O-acyltransferase [Baekduia soli]|uniref:Diacylglycerol O-acyltransferase n=1 Tax=Baekduia soli TaxID=496014 RepID=A0A5B8UB01_9ACTN|nr:wax ester/triacylglycerol synthase family O-acyltransferase [Baekduia soli]QEC49801.1 wax ester/triacylglycerol synthase family O-acyltransferase [Baekduia soli]
MSSSRTMPAADTAWLRMDRPTNHMVITSVMTFDEPVDLDRFRALMQERIVDPFPPFRRIVTAPGPLSAPRWADDPDFDIDLHLHRIALPAPGDRGALEALVGDLMARGMERERPLWDVHLVEGLGDGCALVVRMHHCIADGIALAQVLLTMTDAAEPDPSAVERPARPGRRLPLGPLAGPVGALAGLGRDAASALLHESMRTVVHPARLLELGREARDDATALLTLLTVPSEHETLLKGEHGVAQRVAWTPPLPLADVKAIAHATQTTVNDVLLAALSGGLARYLADRGETEDELCVMVPFNLRPPGRPLPANLGNRFGLILLALPLGDRPPGARLAEVHARMRAIKDSRQPAMSYAILGVMGRTPARVQAWVMDLFSAKSTAVVTNVPGPREPVRLAGVPVREVLVWAPCAGSIGMSVSIFSYCDHVTVGVMTHASLVPDPELLADAVTAELGALGRATAQPSS